MLDVAFEKRLPDFTVRLAFRHESGVLALFGVSGAGKSVTLQTIAGLTRPDSGWIALNGEPLVDVRRRVYVPPERRSVGYVPQHYALFPHLTVVQNIAFGLGGVPKGERRSRIDDLLTLLDLAPLADRRPAQLSGGQQQRVALARALATRPRLLLLDEPFAALDTPLRRSLRRELVALHRRFATPMIIVSHDIADVSALNATMIVMDRGQALQTGTVAEVFRCPASPDVARIVGARNLLRGRVTAMTDGGAVVAVGPLTILTTSAAPQGATVTVALAPDQLLLVRPEAPPSATPTLTGTIVDETRLGPIHTLTWRPDGATDSTTDLEIDIAAGPYHELGVSTCRRWRLRVPPEAVTVWRDDPRP